MPCDSSGRLESRASSAGTLPGPPVASYGASWRSSTAPGSAPSGPRAGGSRPCPAGSARRSGVRPWPRLLTDPVDVVEADPGARRRPTVHGCPRSAAQIRAVPPQESSSLMSASAARVASRVSGAPLLAASRGEVTERSAHGGLSEIRAHDPRPPVPERTRTPAPSTRSPAVVPESLTGGGTGLSRRWSSVKVSLRLLRWPVRMARQRGSVPVPR